MKVVETIARKHGSRFRLSARRVAMLLVATAGGLCALVPASASKAESTEKARPQGSASCAEDCNRIASECLDACEEKFKDDDKARVTCKFECATKRKQCAESCG